MPTTLLITPPSSSHPTISLPFPPTTPLGTALALIRSTKLPGPLYFSHASGLPILPSLLSTPLSRFATPLCLRATPRLRGGKGGFGSQLRAQGGRMARRATASSTDNFRTAGGRRVRAVRQARALAAHLDAKEEKAGAKLKARREKLQTVGKLQTVQETKQDPDYLEDRNGLGETVRNAVKETVQVHVQHGKVQTKHEKVQTKHEKVHVQHEKVQTKTGLFFDTDIESDTGESS